MRIRDSAIGLVFAFGFCPAAFGQQPDETGKHAYAGEYCSWASFAGGYYVEMSYGEFSGKVEVNDPGEGFTEPFVWRMKRPGGSVTSSTASTAKSALNGLCGAMIVAHEEARQYDRDTAFQDLLSALGQRRVPPLE